MHPDQLSRGDLREPRQAAHESLLITADEVATMIGISTRTLWRLLSAGKLPTPVRIGGSTRWQRDAIREWIRSGCPTPSKA